jgi:tetratricopeptide (TPR) repeat protein
MSSPRRILSSIVQNVLASVSWVTLPFSNFSIKVRRWPNGLLSILLIAIFATGSGAQTSSVDDSVLKQHYDMAQSLQASGNLQEAARHYRLFIADALGEMALEAATLKEYDKAAPLFDESLRLAPRSPGLIIRYAQAALAANDLQRTKTLTEGVLRDYPTNVKADAKARLLLGQVMLKMNQEAAARDQFEAAVALDPNFENGYALAIACLDLGDGAGAAKVFTEMVAGLGDTAALHMEIGRAYLNSDFQQEAAPEFRKAIEKDSNLAGAHYSLAVAYLTTSGNNALEMAKRELKLELGLSPNDASTHAQLGNIALRQHNYADADHELKRAIALDANIPDSFFYLGQLYNDTGRSDEAVAAFRQSIFLTKDPAYNRYQIQKVHYLLGHLLIRLEQAEAGRRELQISADLLNRSLNRDRDRLAGYLNDASTPAFADDKEPTASVDAPRGQRSPGASKLEAYEKRIAPALADSYNNLGVIAAGDHAFADALSAFHRAFEWNPELEGLNANWGLAAFRSEHYSEAIPPLIRYLRSHSEDLAVRSELAISQFHTRDYSGTLETLKPIAPDIDATPQLAYIFAASLVKTGNRDVGVKRLLRLEQDNPQMVEVHAVLGEAYEKSKDFTHAVLEFGSLVKLTPSDAFAYRSLGAVQIRQGNLREAVQNLEIASKLDPQNLDNHRNLSLAYRKSLRGRDADREQAIYETLIKNFSNQTRPTSH